MQTRNSSSTWAIWQLLDSALPTGGFAHSQGLEAASQSGWVTDSASSVEKFCRLSIHNQAGLVLPYVTASHSSASALSIRPEPSRQEADSVVSRVLGLDLQLDCQMRGNHVARRASLALGSALIRASMSAFGRTNNAIHLVLKGLKEARQGIHQACVFGTLTGLLGLELAGVHEMFMFLHIRDVMSAATRLNLIGPLEAAGLLHGLGRVASLVLLEAQLKPDDDGHDSGYVHAYASSPLLDALQASHNDMYSRLFSS